MMLPSRRKWFLVTAICAAGVLWGGNQGGGDRQVAITPRPKPTAKEEVLPKSNIRSDVNLVLIPVTVTDPLNRFVTADGGRMVRRARRHLQRYGRQGFERRVIGEGLGGRGVPGALVPLQGFRTGGEPVEVLTDGVVGGVFQLQVEKPCPAE